MAKAADRNQEAGSSGKVFQILLAIIGLGLVMLLARVAGLV